MNTEGTVEELNPYAQRHRPFLRRIVGRLAGIMVLPILLKLLEREKIRQFVIQYLSDRFAMEEASFQRRMPSGLAEIRGFEDCSWLFASNQMNHGLARLTFDEAAFLYRLVKEMQHPRVADLGRYKGGGTFLLAAAGAEVLSLDNDALPGQVEYMNALERALGRVSLLEHVENVLGDALTYPVNPDSFDLVLIDFPSTGALMRAAFEHWWPAVKPGGFLLIRDGKCSPLLEVVDFATHLDIGSHGGTRIPGCPGAFVLFLKNAG